VNETLQNQVADLLAKLAEQLGVGTEFLWGVLIKQAAVDGALAAVMVLLCFAYFAGYGAFTAYCLKNTHSSEAADAARIFGAILLIPVSVSWIWNLWMAVTALINPEYYALQQILEVLK
jgi:hypothetical protein